MRSKNNDRAATAATHRTHPAGGPPAGRRCQPALAPIMAGMLASLLLPATSPAGTDASASASASAANATGDSSTADTSTTAATDTGGIQEVTVTAEKFSSTIQNTPISISALTGDQLQAAGLTSVEDVARAVPGLSMRSAGPGQTEYEARGLASNGGAAPTVGFYLDEVPLSPPAASQAGKIVIDPDLYDLARIEVLRGPQGTLYGSGSMGGTVRLITNEPKLDTWEGSVQATGSGTEGGGANGGGSGMINIPLGSTLALRVVATENYRSGWIDRIDVGTAPFLQDGATSINGVPQRGDVANAPVLARDNDANTVQTYGGRATLLFQPSDDLSVLASVLYQKQRNGGYDEYDSPPGAAYMAHYEAFDLPEQLHDLIRIYSLTINANLGFADLTSASAYWNRMNWQTQDASESIYTANAGGTPFIPVPYSELDPSHQFSQEIRLTSHDSEHLHWVAGAFFSDLTSDWDEYSDGLAPPNTIPGDPTNAYFDSINPYHMKQYALFGDGSWKFNDQWKLSAGLRWFRYQTELDDFEYGYDAFYATPPTTPLVIKAAARGFTPRVNLSYSPTADITTYIQAAKGFRPGGANQLFPPPDQPPHCSVAPLTFDPDTVWDYEAGAKTRWLDNRLIVNGDLYYIQWNGVQQAPLLGCGYQYYTNAGNGRSFGPELEINSKLTDALTFSINGVYTDAKLTSPDAGYLAYLTTGAFRPDGSGPWCATTAGCTAPILNIPKYTASFSLAYDFTAAPGYDLSARFSDSIVGPTMDEAYYYGIQLPSYAIAGARLILTHNQWSTTLFIDNLFNRVAAITANNTSFQFNIPELVRYSTNQPRTFGLQLNYAFK